jgi:hypothetical protein
MTAALQRIGEATRPFGDGEVVGSRPCRGCGQPCDVTDAGMRALKAFNGILLARDEMPLNETKTFACERCEMRVRDAIGQSNREKVDEMEAIIRDLKESIDPPSETAILERLAQLHHPDIPGLLHAISERKASEKQGGKRR